MTLMKWDPWREIEDMFDRYTKAVGWPRGGQEALSSSDWTPRVDIAETETEFLIKADIPGVEKEHVKVSLENGVLTIQGERKTEKEEKDKKFHRVERFTGTFMRRFTVPENVDAEGIKAVFKDGMLHLHLPKTEKSGAKAIDIHVD
ncbi:MAG: Hsp20/alpha crystallin family protein [Desulfomicrobium sp.]|nr:Hsp20/alpha crystallin family protein [Desulfomicrobium sp.]MDP3430027.1 Hsp20/alpha crystallin family protein [Desulfomicrobium sp.]